MLGRDTSLDPTKNMVHTVLCSAPQIKFIFRLSYSYINFMGEKISSHWNDWGDNCSNEASLKRKPV